MDAGIVKGDFVKFHSQYGGSALYGKVLAAGVKWDDGDANEIALIQYLWEKGDDPPRRPYTLRPIDELTKLERIPSDFVYSKYYL